MKGWQIFVHSVRLVFNNFGAALQISFALYLVSVAVQVHGYLNADVVAGMEAGNLPENAPSYFITTFLLSLLGLVASLWIAVAWHRYVLNEEYPSGFLPRLHGGAMLGYLGRSLLIGLIVGVCVLVASLPLGLLAVLAPPLAILIVPLAIGLASILFFRLGPILPACAIGNRLTLGEAWQATRGEAATFIVLGVVVGLATIVVMLPSLVNTDPSSLINLVYVLVVNWFVTIIGISLLTTVYGHFIEGRSID